MSPDSISPVSPTPKGVVGLGTQVDGPAGTDRDSPGLGTRWLEGVREHQEKQARMKALRAELAACREAGKRIRHANRMRQLRARERENQP